MNRIRYPFTHVVTIDSVEMESPRDPVAGVDYPGTSQEFDASFGCETALREYIRRLRWPDGFVCSTATPWADPWEMSRSLLRCQARDRQVSLTTGTVLQDTRKPLGMWLLAMWLVTRRTASALWACSGCSAISIAGAPMPAGCSSMASPTSDPATDLWATRVKGILICTDMRGFTRRLAGRKRPNARDPRSSRKARSARASVRAEPALAPAGSA